LLSLEVEDDEVLPREEYLLEVKVAVRTNANGETMIAQQRIEPLQHGPFPLEDERRVGGRAPGQVSLTISELPQDDARQVA
jgi:hypothetical protein